MVAFVVLVLIEKTSIIARFDYNNQNLGVKRAFIYIMIKGLVHFPKNVC